MEICHIGGANEFCDREEVKKTDHYSREIIGEHMFLFRIVGRNHRNNHPQKIEIKILHTGLIRSVNFKIYSKQ